MPNSSILSQSAPPTFTSLLPSDPLSFTHSLDNNLTFYIYPVSHKGLAKFQIWMNQKLLAFS